MQLREIMTRDVDVVNPETTLERAAQVMRESDVGPVPVCDGDRIVGMLTDRDITVRAVAEGRDPKEARVRDAMTPEVIYCFETDEVSKAARLMEEQQVRRLIVVDNNKQLVGIVSLGDIVSETGDTRQSGEVLREISAPGGMHTTT